MELNFLKIFIFLSIITGITACSSFEEPDNTSGTSVISIPLNLETTITSYDNISKTRAYSWTAGDVLYLNFKSGEKGRASYDGSSWIVTFPGSLAKTGTLTVTWLENPGKELGNSVSMSTNTAVYQAEGIAYQINQSGMTISCQLCPMLPRVRFCGEPEDLYIEGLKYCTSFNTATGNFNTASDRLFVPAGSEDVYYYCTLANDDRNLNLYTRQSAWSSTISNTAFHAGESGVLHTPSLSNANNWITGVKFLCQDSYKRKAEWTMMPVPFNNSYFLIGQTEITEALIFVIGYGVPSFIQKPYTERDVSNFKTIVNKIAQRTALPFRLPTEQEWFAAFNAPGRNGEQYIYSGSNNINEVAWYKENATSLQEVAQKMPNSYGLYDMSGNAWEVVSDKEYTLYGGGCYSTAEQCERGFSTSTSDIPYLNLGTYGARLALDNPFNH